MKARILDQSEESKWDRFVEKQAEGNLNQMSVWGRFQSAVPARGPYWIVVLEERGEIVGGGLVIKHRLPRGKSWLYAVRGPLIAPEMMETWACAVEPIAEREQAIFLRCDPLSGQRFKGFREIPEGYQPQHTLIVDLRPEEEEILEQMKQKGRYNIRLAEKKGVKVEKSTDVEAFYRLLSETTERDGFSGHGKEYYQKMLEMLGEGAALYVAKYEGEVVAAAIVTYFGTVATYYYGVSGNAHRNVMAPYLLHWEIMREAKKMGYQSYDLFGIAPAGREKGHAWEGVTGFKRKFGGKERSYARPQEMVFRFFWYWLYRLYKYWRKN